MLIFLWFWHSQESSDQSKIDTNLVFYVGFATSMCISVVTNIAITCQVAWPSVIAVLPLLLLNIWYRVWCDRTTTMHPRGLLLILLNINTTLIIESIIKWISFLSSCFSESLYCDISRAYSSSRGNKGANYWSLYRNLFGCPNCKVLQKGGWVLPDKPGQDQFEFAYVIS